MVGECKAWGRAVCAGSVCGGAGVSPWCRRLQANFRQHPGVEQVAWEGPGRGELWRKEKPCRDHQHTASAQCGGCDWSLVYWVSTHDGVEKAATRRQALKLRALG